MDEYIEQHIDPEPRWLSELYRDANLRLLYTRMMSGHTQGRLLKMLTQMINPRCVLELGTFAGYSTMCIAEGLAPDAVIDTVEIDDELEPFLNSHFGSSPFAGKIRLHIGDAMEVVPRLFEEGNRWDMALIDADKRLYPDYYELLMNCMVSGSWILADNTLWNGMVGKPFPEGKKLSGKEEQLAAIARFNDMVACDSRVEKTIIPVRDGLTIIRIK